MPLPMKSRYDSNKNYSITNYDTSSIQSSLQDDWNEEDEREMQATVEELYEYLGYEKEDATCSEITERTANTAGGRGGGGGDGGMDKRRPSSSFMGSTIDESSVAGEDFRRPKQRSSSKTKKKKKNQRSSSVSRSSTSSLTPKRRTTRSNSTERRSNSKQPQQPPAQYQRQPSRDPESRSVFRSRSPPSQTIASNKRSSSLTRSKAAGAPKSAALAPPLPPPPPPQQQQVRDFRNESRHRESLQYSSHPREPRYQRLQPSQNQLQPQQQQQQQQQYLQHHLRVLHTISPSQTTSSQMASTRAASAAMSAVAPSCRQSRQGREYRRSTAGVSTRSCAQHQPHPAQSQPQQPPIRYSFNELVATLNQQKDTSQLSPELERRVLDFRMAQQKRLEKYGTHNRHGIFGLYAHLSHVRADLEWSEDAAWRRTHRRPYLSWSDFDDIQSKHPIRPWFTYFVIFLCSLMMIVEFALNDWKIEPLSVNPLIGPSAQALIDAGARVTSLIIEGQWFRIFSPLFLHAGIIHYVINMAALWFIGAAVEQSHGILNAMILFFVPGVGGNILSSIFLPQYISVGASGGIFGLIGGCVADITLNWKLLFISDPSISTLPSGAAAVSPSNANHSPQGDSTASREATTRRRNNIMAIFWLVAEIAINLIIGLTPYVDNFCHIGGMVYGVCCGWSAIEPLAVSFFGVSSTYLEKAQKMIMRYMGLIVSIVLIIVTTIILATMNVGESPCSNCRYVSCVPFPFWTEHKWWYCDDCDFVTATLYKNPDGDEFYDMIDLTCPGGQIQSIPLNHSTTSTNSNSFNFTSSNIVNGTLDGSGADDRDEIRRQLPTYCRQYCPTTKT